MASSGPMASSGLTPTGASRPREQRADTAAALHVRASVHPALSGLVARIIGYRIAGLAPGVHVGMPSRHLTLVLPLDGDLQVGWAGAAPTGYRGVLSGLCSRPAAIHHDGNLVGVQLDLTPAAARRIFGLPAAELAEDCLELSAVTGEGGAQLIERVTAAGDWQQRFDLVTHWLASAGGSGRDFPQPEIGWAWRRLVASGGAVTMAQLSDEVGWSPAHLARSFRREVGLTPKTVARTIRFERSHRLVQRGLPLAEVAARCGYADQPHLNRDWLQFAGTAPTRWRRDDALAFA